ncbi:hypothetical protein BLL52_1491 [Rhodoferax antarcticus ANT.BR]|uniref:Uncharacterized protein n=1 Tax=Rhodoferax antarcticus ANT.BR TaxID=1111071 RepID=A0A1Q8YGL5_9BURK|nr:hypothetical protein BLL52_1491 [Rhodoferax antarcticus ANT.BR]
MKGLEPYLPFNPRQAVDPCADTAAGSQRRCSGAASTAACAA